MNSRVVRAARSAVLRLTGAPSYRCPICGFRGPFLPYEPPTGLRLHAACPWCGALERHRTQWAVAAPLIEPSMAVLHLAPEPFIGALLRRRVKRYVSGDIGMRGVDCRLDVTRLPYRDATFDVVWASHVLEHVREDGAALAEISRVLRRGGIAMLAVPISGDTTIEFAAPDPDDSFHVRSPGMDYFHRYAPFFSEVRITDSWALPPQIQPFVCADRGGRAGEPRASSGPVGIHPDYVPICLR